MIDIYGNERDIDCDGKDGVIDSDYTGIVGVIIRNEENVRSLVVPQGERIAQILFIPVYNVEFNVCSKLESTSRDGGFGSTGA